MRCIVVNRDCASIFCISEEHWPNEKTANEVGSKLIHTIEKHKSEKQYKKFKRLCLHIDNCGGQNKNRYMLWLLALRAILGLEEHISLNFLVAGHKKNRCDAAFGFVKRKLKQ